MKKRKLEGVSGLELVDAAWLPGRRVSRERSRKAGVAARTFQDLNVLVERRKDPHQALHVKGCLPRAGPRAKSPSQF
jgi:hypothetical protein